MPNNGREWSQFNRQIEYISLKPRTGKQPSLLGTGTGKFRRHQGCGTSDEVGKSQSLYLAVPVQRNGRGQQVLQCEIRRLPAVENGGRDRRGQEGEPDALADRVVVLKDGRVIADDTADGLRTRMGGAIIECVTALDDDALNALPGLIALSRSGRKLRLQVSNAVPALKALFELDPELSDLGVAQPTLEDAFEALTGQPQTEGA